MAKLIGVRKNNGQVASQPSVARRALFVVLIAFVVVAGGCSEDETTEGTGTGATSIQTGTVASAPIDLPDSIAVPGPRHRGADTLVTVSRNGRAQVIVGEIKSAAIKDALIVSLPAQTNDQNQDRFASLTKTTNGWSATWREAGLLVLASVNVADEQLARSFVAEVLIVRGSDLADFAAKYPVLRQAGG